MIFINMGDVIAGQTVGISRVITIDGECISIVLVQPVLRAKPHKALTVLQDAAHNVIGQALRAGEMGESWRGGLCKCRGAQPAKEYEDQSDAPYVLAEKAFSCAMRFGQGSHRIPLYTRFFSFQKTSGGSPCPRILAVPFQI